MLSTISNKTGLFVEVTMIFQHSFSPTLSCNLAEVEFEREGGGVIGVSLQTYIISAQPTAAATEMETTALRE